jgi:hypothetical protein
LGNVLVFYRGNRGPESGNGFGPWQATRFAPPNKDLLVYLVAFRGNGYLQAQAYSRPYRAFELVLSSWRSNSAGMINFQNPTAVTNSGSLLEVLVTAAVKNAAAKTRVGLNLTATKFITNLMDELGVSARATKVFDGDKTLSAIRILPMLLFTKACHLNQFAGMNDILGVAERQQDRDQFDLRQDLTMKAGQICCCCSK